jgi:hypothetical protein
LGYAWYCNEKQTLIQKSFGLNGNYVQILPVLCVALKPRMLESKTCRTCNESAISPQLHPYGSYWRVRDVRLMILILPCKNCRRTSSRVPLKVHELCPCGWSEQPQLAEKNCTHYTCAIYLTPHSCVLCWRACSTVARCIMNLDRRCKLLFRCSDLDAYKNHVVKQIVQTQNPYDLSYLA